MTDNTRGALLMIVSMLAFTVNDAAIKATSGEIPFFQLLFLRGVLSSLLMAAALQWLRHLWLPVPRTDRQLIAIRSLSEIVATMVFLTALFNMSLANVIALFQMLPLTVTLALCKPVGQRRMVAIMIGFCGMLLIVRPGISGCNVYKIYALLAVVCETFRDLSTRQVPSLVITFASSARLTVLASLGKTWEEPDWHLSGLFVLSVLFIFAGYCSSVMVMRVGELSAVTPFRYTSLLWALLLGWLAFDEWPTTLTFLGVAFVAASELYTLYRESKLSRLG